MTQFDARLTRLRSLGRRGIARPITPGRRAALPAPGDSSATDQAALTASIASTGEQRRAAAALVASRYAWRGYAVDEDGGMRSPGITLIATAGRRTLGTLTVRADGPAGLAADECYCEAIDAIRRRGRSVGELTRFAIDAAADWRPTLGALVGLAYAMCRTYDVTDVFVEVNPRHERFYRRVFGFVAAGARRICPRVDAPAVLLQLDLERLEQKMLGTGAPLRPAAPGFGVARLNG